MDSREIAEKIVDAASDKVAGDIVILDTKVSCSFADYFVICSGESGRQLTAIRDSVIDQLEKADVDALHKEGNADSGWILVDFGDVVVHIFATKTREFYAFDQLWSNSPLVLRVQ